MNRRTRRFNKIFSQYRKAKILVVGDLILDIFVWGKVRRISPEAPVPVVEVDRNSAMLGGAANVAHNLKCLGGNVSIAGVVGKDSEGKQLLDQISALGINAQGVFKDSRRPTTVKTRVIAHHQQIVRIDREQLALVGDLYHKSLLKLLHQKKKQFHAILIEDYGKGVVSQELVKLLVGFGKKNNCLVAVDPQKGRFIDYRGIHVATPNYAEACYYAGMKEGAETDVERVGKTLLRKWDCEILLITLGEKGMCLFEKGKKPLHVSTAAREIFDVSGAGDTVISIFILSLVSGASCRDAAVLANIAAGLVIGKLGTAVVGVEELKKELDNVR